jgi:hypothetical protein
MTDPAKWAFRVHLKPEQGDILYQRAAKLGSTPTELATAYVVDGLRFESGIQGNLNHMAGELARLANEVAQLRRLLQQQDTYPVPSGA